MMLIKSMGSAGVRGSTFALFFCLGSVILLTPLAVWQTVSGDYQLTWTDTWIVIIGGLVYTALCFSLYTDGIRFVRVEHAGVILSRAGHLAAVGLSSHRREAAVDDVRRRRPHRGRRHPGDRLRQRCG